MLLKIFLAAFHFYKKLDTATYFISHTLGIYIIKIIKFRNFADL